MSVYPFKASRSPFRGLAQDYIFSAVRQGQSTMSIISTLRELNLSYHTQDMTNDIHWWRNAISNWENMKDTPVSQILSSKFYLPTTSIRKGVYQTAVDIHFTNPNTGEELLRTVTVIHTDPETGEYETGQKYTINRLKNDLSDLINKYTLQGYDMAEFSPVAGFYNPDKI